MELEYLINQTLELEQKSPAGKNIFAGGIISIIIFLVFISIIIQKNNKKRGLVLISVAAVFAILGGVFAVPIIVEESQYLRGLQKDAQEQVILEANGVVEDINTYARGRSECLINGDYFRFLVGVPNSFGAIKTGWQYNFKYLKNSRYIVDMKVIDQHELKDNCWLKTTDLNLFGYSYYPIYSWKQLDDVVLDYVKSYFWRHDLDSYEKFCDETKIIYTYFREDLNLYVSYVSLKDNENNYIYMMFDPETGKPVYFEENW